MSGMSPAHYREADPFPLRSVYISCIKLERRELEWEEYYTFTWEIKRLGLRHKALAHTVAFMGMRPHSNSLRTAILGGSATLKGFWETLVQLFIWAHNLSP